jgi:hypothetical protein
VVDELAFPVEEIPDADAVFMRAHRMHFSGADLKPGVFRAQQGSMSVNWNKYASAEDTRQQARKNPEQNAVISLLVGGIRKIRDLDVKHMPDYSNRAHSEIILPTDDEDLTEARVMLHRLAIIVIPLAQ